MNLNTFFTGFLVTGAAVMVAISGEKQPVYSGKGLVEESTNYQIQALNPLAEVQTFAVENYYMSDFQGFSDDANQLLLRYADPFSVGGTDWLFKATLPINHYPDGTGSTETGLGDLTIQTCYLFETSNPNVSFGIGPSFRFPTATDGAILGHEKWSAGLANTYFNGADEKFQFGYTLSWMQSFAGDSGRGHYHVGAFQPFMFYQLGNGWYTGTAPIWMYDFSNDSYSIPLGLRLGRVMEMQNGSIMNAFVEPQIAVFDHGPALPNWQIFAGIRIQCW